MPISLTIIKSISLQYLEWYAPNLLIFFFVYFKARRTKEKHESKTNLAYSDLNL